MAKLSFCSVAAALMSVTAIAAGVSVIGAVQDAEAATYGGDGAADMTTAAAPLDTKIDVARIVTTLGYVPEPSEAIGLAGRTALVLADENAGPQLDVRSAGRTAPGLRDERRAVMPYMGDPDQAMRLTYTGSAGTVASAGGFDVHIAPKASVVVGDEVSGGGAGAVVRIGRNLSRSRTKDDRGWYLFVGADAQALTWRLDAGLPIAQAVRLEDQTIVGDAQAGVAWRFGPADVALAVMHREVKYNDVKRQETYIGVSFVMTHY